MLSWVVVVVVVIFSTVMTAVYFWGHNCTPMFQHKLQINGAPSALLSTAKGRTTMTNVLCTNLKLKFLSMGQKKFVIPHLLR
jgi:hypothetical protein